MDTVDCGRENFALDLPGFRLGRRFQIEYGDGVALETVQPDFHSDPALFARNRKQDLSRFFTEIQCLVA